MIKDLLECRDSRDWEKAFKIYNMIPPDAGEDWQPVFRSALSCLCKAFRYQEARQVFERLPKKDTPAYNFVLQMLARLRNVDEFNAVLQEMDTEGVPRSAVTYSQIMTSCIADHRWSEALFSLDNLKAESALHDSANWDVAYLLPMVACARAHQRQKVQELLNEYQTSGKGTPQRNHYNCLIVACGSDGQAAEQVFQDLRQEGWTPARPDWHALMISHTNCQEQRRVFAQMRQEFPDVLVEEAWAILLRTAVANDDLEAADWVLQDMHENGCDVDSPQVQSVPSLKRAISSWKVCQQDVQIARSTSKNGNGLATTNTLDSPLSAGGGLPDGWKSATANSGRPYYWRVEDPTGTTTWERPVKT